VLARETGTPQPSAIVSLNALLQRGWLRHCHRPGTNRSTWAWRLPAPDTSTSTPEAVCSTTGQAEALHTLLRNLLDNAVKYSPPGIQVDVRSSNDHCTLSVETAAPSHRRPGPCLTAANCASAKSVAASVCHHLGDRRAARCQVTLVLSSSAVRSGRAAAAG
jgi:hypothetical protein